MQYICHRINTVSELQAVSLDYGVELDIRDDIDGDLYLSHDPFVEGENFEDYLKCYNKKTMIINVKSERVEWRIKDLLEKYKIEDYFFLDSSFPMIYEMMKRNERKIALRVSEYESMENARMLKGKVGWIWVDCFEDIPISEAEAEELHRLGYKLCLVSPELQGRDECIESYAPRIASMNFDAICTKKYNIERWKKLLGK